MASAIKATGLTVGCIASSSRRPARKVASGEEFGPSLQICAYGASDQAAFAALFKLTHYPISREIAQCLNGGYGWLEVMRKRCETRASLPLDAIRRPQDTPIWKLEAALKCRSCRTHRYSPPVHMIKLTREREIAPYVWVHPDDDR